MTANREWSIVADYTGECAPGPGRYAYGSTIIGDRDFAEQAMLESAANAGEEWSNFGLAEIDIQRDRLTDEEWARAQSEMERVAVRATGSTGGIWFDEE